MKIARKDAVYAGWLHASGLVGSLLWLAGIPFLNYIVPLVLWLAKKNESEFIDFHGREHVRFQLFYTLWGIIALLIIVMPFFLLTGTYFGGFTESTFGIVFLLSTSLVIVPLCILIFELVLIIMAIVKGFSGELFCFWGTFSPRKKVLKRAKT